MEIAAIQKPQTRILQEAHLTVKQVADHLNVSKKSAYRLISEGHLVAFKVLNVLRVPRSSLEEYKRRQIYLYRLGEGLCGLNDE